MSDKICPLLTMMSMHRQSTEDHIFYDYEEPCMGEKCAWYEKCFPEPVPITYHDPYAPVHVTIDSMPMQGYIDPTTGNWVFTGGSAG